MLSMMNYGPKYMMNHTGSTGVNFFKVFCVISFKVFPTVYLMNFKLYFAQRGRNCLALMEF